MEHRYSTRTAVAADIEVHCRSRGRLSARLADISPGGALITLSDGHLPLNAPVTVTFRIGGKELILWAMVVRISDCGTGIMFLEREDHIARALSPLFEQHSPIQSRRRTYVSDEHRADDLLGVQ